MVERVVADFLGHSLIDFWFVNSSVPMAAPKPNGEPSAISMARSSGSARNKIATGPQGRTLVHRAGHLARDPLGEAVHEFLIKARLDNNSFRRVTGVVRSYASARSLPVRETP
ncbi:hypothetical protein A4R44_03219 [Amycolatopsis sp. M39]|nr:hypothetical protein A4R44_03219 [Amycolatopsis sp. M39]